MNALNRARAATGEQIADSIIAGARSRQNAREGRTEAKAEEYRAVCRVRNCSKPATSIHGRCQRCEEEWQALNGQLGGLTIDGTVPWYRRWRVFGHPIWHWTVAVPVFVVGSVLGAALLVWIASR